MKSLSDTDQKKIETAFKDAVAWHMPEVQGNIINKDIKPEKKTTIDEARHFEERINQQINKIKQRKDNPTYLTVSQLQEIQKQAYDEAFKQGYDEAFQKGTAEAQEYIKNETESQRNELRQKAQQLQNAFNALAKPLSDIDTAVEQQLTEMVFFLSRQILDHELSINPEHITRVLQQAISRLPMAQRNVLIKLNPADIALLQNNDIEIEGHDWKLEADDSVAKGGCLVESESVRIDRRMETRMRELARQLFEGLDEPDLSVQASDTDNINIDLEVTDD